METTKEKTVFQEYDDAIGGRQIESWGTFGDF